MMSTKCIQCGYDGCDLETENEKLRSQLSQVERENDRLRAPHAKDCGFLLNGKREGRWDCDCAASEVVRLHERLAETREVLNQIAAQEGKTLLAACCMDQSCHLNEESKECSFQTGARLGFEHCASLARAGKH